MPQTVAVVDYGMGNLHSVAKALEHVGGTSRVNVSSDPEEILTADRVVFPGVGAIRDCLAELDRRQLIPVIREVAGRVPLLAICVGMQALMEYSEENDGVDCLGVLPGTVRRFPGGTDEHGNRLKVPHMGWNTVVQTGEHPLWRGIETGERFYFVHSYYVESTNLTQLAGVCGYGCSFAAALKADALFAVQFHPEKSNKAGLKLLQNFVAWDGAS